MQSTVHPSSASLFRASSDCWVGTCRYSVLFCPVLGLSGGILADLLVAGKNRRDYLRSAAQEHFIDLCRMLDEPAPTDADPNGDWYAFERGATKTTGGEGWAERADHSPGRWKSCFDGPLRQAVDYHEN